MNIANNSISYSLPTANRPLAKELHQAPNSDSLVERIIDKTYLSANYAASGLAGGVSGLGAYAYKGLANGVKTTGSAIANIVKTEKYGPVLKAASASGALVAGVAATAIAAPVSLLWGIYEGTSPVDNSVPRQFTVKEGIEHSYSKVGGAMDRVGRELRQELREFGNYKLKPGEKPIEIPLVRAAKTALMGAVGAVVGGAVGVLTAVTSAATETARGVASAWTDSRLNLGEKVLANATSTVGGVVHGLSYGLSSGLSTFAHAIGDTYRDDSMIEGGKKLFKNAASALLVSVAPRATLLEEQKPA